MDALAMLWANARVANLLAVWRMTPVEVGNGQEEGYDTYKDNPLMYTQKAETLEPFSSHVIPVKRVKVYLGECINIMVQALYTQDGTLLPGLTMENTYTELKKGSKKVVVVVWNNTTYPQTPQKKTPMARAISALSVPEPPKSESLQVRDDRHSDLQILKLMVRQRHGKLFHDLDLVALIHGLQSWQMQPAGFLPNTMAYSH